MKLLRDTIILILGILIATQVFSGISYVDNQTLILVTLVLTVFNLVLKPLMILFVLPFVIITMGFGIWLINAGLLYFAGNLIDGFNVASFPTALGGAFIISLTSIIINILLSPKKKFNVQWSVNRSGKSNSSSRIDSREKQKSQDDVIDV